MAAESKWLSFSVSSTEMVNHSSSSSSSVLPADYFNHCTFADNFYATGWTSQKVHEMYAQPEPDSPKPSILASYMLPPPKLEDFFAAGGGDSTETQESSLTYLVGGDKQDLKTITGFQAAFSGNSGSEVDDPAYVAGQTQSPVDSAAELAAVTANASTKTSNINININDKAIVGSCKKIGDTFGQRTSIYRGVTRHRWTGRYEAHLWDNSCRREGQARKGRQVYLGGYDKEDKAAQSYDLAALKYWGPSATTNFPIGNYMKEIEEMKHMTKQEFIASLRRKSSGFSRGASIYRGVTRHHQQGRWQARIGRVAGNKDLYLGTFATEEEAAEAYDIAAIKFRGVNAVTNFEINRYDVEAIARSPLPIGGTAKKLKLSLEAGEKLQMNTASVQSPYSRSSISFASLQPIPTIPCGVPFDTTNAVPFYHQNLFHHHHLSSGTPNASSTSSSLVPTPNEFFLWPHQY